MCGIVGYWNLANNRQEHLRKELKNAVTSISHRGPDDTDFWFNGQGVGLGHARLAIIDLSQRGHQPMVSEDGRYILVFNGEIYNFLEIRNELEARGFHFYGSSDSEVILVAFEAWGVRCVHRFNGMFAFAIWDQKSKKMFLFRDRVGVKPLYYGWYGQIFCFGSELKAICSFKHWPRDINKQALGEFLQYGYIAAPRSIYKKAFKLLPGHWLELSHQETEPLIQRYWSLQTAVDKGPLEGGEDELAEQLEELLISSFCYRMVSDVPVGVFLSGGIDSSIVAAILQKHSGQQIQTFTIGFDDKSCDESVWAKKVAQHLRTQHTEKSLDLDETHEILPKLQRIFDEPFGDSSAIPTVLLSSMARKKVKVALSADGGDELFGGYNCYTLNPARLRAIAGKPHWLRNLTGRGLSSLPIVTMMNGVGAFSKIGLAFPSTFLRKMIKLESVLPDGSPSSIFRASQSLFMPQEIDRMIGGYQDPRVPAKIYSGSFEEKMMQWDFQYYLPDDIMVKVDRATMNFGLEGREPMLDHRLIEFAFRLPMHLRIGNLGQKHLLRKVLYRYVPQELVDRPKQGFTAPIDKWMRGDKEKMVKGMIQSTSRLKSVLDLNMVKREVRLLQNGGGNGTRVWHMRVLHEWLEEYGMNGRFL